MRSGGRQVLVVEDSPAMRQLLVMALTKLDVEVAEAEDGLAALKILAKRRFDLMFADLNMPILDGMKLIKRVREDRSLGRMKICVCTTEASPAVEAEARALGAEFFLRKPVSRRDIERVLADAFPG